MFSPKTRTAVARRANRTACIAALLEFRANIEELETAPSGYQIELESCCDHSGNGHAVVFTDGTFAWIPCCPIGDYTRIAGGSYTSLAYESVLMDSEQNVFSHREWDYTGRSYSFIGNEGREPGVAERAIKELEEALNEYHSRHN